MKIDKNTTIIITGAASGLGQQTAIFFSTKQANVVIADIDQQKGKKLADKLHCLFFKTDVTNQQNIKQLFQFTLKKFPQIHIVVNCAGVALLGPTLDNTGKLLPTAQMVKTFMINVVGTFNVSKYAALHMSKQKQIQGQRGVIILVSSIIGIQGKNNQISYATSKGAIIGMTLPLARDLGKFKIRVMTIAPGMFDTPMTYNNPIPGLSYEQFSQYVSSQTPINKIGIPKYFQQLVCSIVQNPFATGTVWNLDGGLRIGYF